VLSRAAGPLQGGRPVRAVRVKVSAVRWTVAAAASVAWTVAEAFSGMDRAEARHVISAVVAVPAGRACHPAAVDPWWRRIQRRGGGGSRWWGGGGGSVAAVVAAAEEAEAEAEDADNRHPDRSAPDS